MDDNNPELLSVKRPTVFHWKLVLVYTGHHYPVRFFRRAVLCSVVV